MQEKKETETVTERAPPTKEEQLRILFGPVRNYSRSKRLAHALLGPQARVWDRNGTIEVGVESGKDKMIFGKGQTFQDAFFAAAFDMSPTEVTDIAGPELRALHTADQRMFCRPDASREQMHPLESLAKAHRPAVTFPISFDI
jgi:hypothetical protein